MEAPAEYLTSLMEGMGIDAIYAATILCIIVLFSYRRDMENWRKIGWSTKGLIVSGILATLVLCTISILQMVGVIDI